MGDLQTKLAEAKARLNQAAARCLTGDRQAAAEADAAMAEVTRLLAEQTARADPQCVPAPHRSEAVGSRT